jgi:AcrR family transcriptional regulator
VSLKTFYRYFVGKDQLLLAVLELMITESCRDYEEKARHLPDPLARLRSYITTAMSSADVGAELNPGARFISAELWRLHQLYPAELAHAVRPFNDLVLRDINAAAGAGVIRPADPTSAAWHINQLVITVYHHYAFAPSDESGEEIGDRLWSFCLAALGGRAE